MRWCLVKESGPVSAASSIDLGGKDEVSIGRNPEATVCISSLRVSRIHAVLTLMGKCWYILDNKSLNGVFINTKKLDPMTHHRLSNGDLIQLGVPALEDKHGISKEDVCIYRFSRITADPAVVAAGRSVMLTAPSVSADCNHACERSGTLGASSSSATKGGTLQQPTYDWLCCIASVSPSEQATTGSRDVGSTLAAACSSMSATSTSADRPAGLAAARAPTGRQASPKLRSSGPAAATELSTVPGCSRPSDGCWQQLSRDDVPVVDVGMPPGSGEGSTCRFSSDQSADDSPPAKRPCSDASAATLSSPAALAGQQPSCSADAAEMLAHNALVASLEAKADKLARLATEEAERRRMLEEQLAAALHQSDTLRREVVQARDALDDVAHLIENELQCCICSELMVKAKSLSCSHSFCSYCIDKWLEQKKECPVCREHFTGASLSYALDSYIDKVVEKMSEEKQAARRQLVNQYKAKQEAARSKSKKEKRGGNSSVTASSARSAGRGSSNRSASTAAPTSALPPPSLANALFVELPLQVGTPIQPEHMMDWGPRTGENVNLAVATIGVVSIPLEPDATTAAAPAAEADVNPGQGATAREDEASTSRPRVPAQARSRVSPIVVLDDSSDEDEAAHDGGSSDSDSESLPESWISAGGTDTPSDGFDDYSESFQYSMDVPGGASSTGGQPPAVPGLPGAYYGGYGSCYHCGNRGHWANGCPYR